MRRVALARTVGLVVAAASTAAGGVPPTPDEIAKLCAEAEGPSDCGRRVEAAQLPRLPNLARRDGDTLVLRLYPAGETRFQDRDTLAGGTSYALFDFISEFNAAVLWVTQDDAMGFVLVQRANGRQTPLPSSPVPSPDRTRFATADFCTAHCENELAVWSIDRENVRRELSWKPAQRWSDATVTWTGADTLAVEYTVEGDSAPRKLVRRLGEPGWTRAASR